MSTRIAVVEHQESCPPALVGRWLAEAGCDLDVVRPYRGDALPDLAARDSPYDGVLVLGGEMSANDDESVAWLAPLKEQVRVLVGSGTPLLGICLGHQLIATALGGRVTKNPGGQTVGLIPIGWTDDAADDPLVGPHTGSECGVHWNGDIVVEHPPGTTVLATSPDGALQVARFGAAAWGIQAHPEVDVAVVRRWAETDYDDHHLRGIDQEAALAKIEAAQDELALHWRPVARRFAALAGAAR